MLIRAAHRNGTAQSLLTRLHEALFAASRHLNELDKDRNPLLPPDLCPKKDLSKIRTFTDNIVIGYPIWDDGEMELGTILSQLSFFHLKW